jgi:transposase InsO family protein
VIFVEFIIGLPIPVRRLDSIMVVVVKLPNETHFIPVKPTHKIGDIEKIFMKEMYRLPKEIVYDRDAKFTFNFWKSLIQDLGTQLNFSTTYYPQIDGQNKRVNQVLEDMLRMYVMYNPSKWEDYPYLVDFASNNGHQASLGMSPFNALYGRGCKSPMSWDNLVDRVVLGLEMIKEMEHEIVKIR